MMNVSRPKVLAISGSIKPGSANQQLIRAIAQLAGNDLEITLFDELHRLPYFIPGETDAVPESVIRFRNEISAADGILVCTPEYVFSLPGVLKNALEWLVSETVLSDKPAALITASSSGKAAYESLLLIMQTLGAKSSEASAMLIPGIKSKIAADGTITDAHTMAEIMKLIEALKGLIAQKMPGLEH
jgi:chromate reductase